MMPSVMRRTHSAWAGTARHADINSHQSLITVVPGATA
jgi:hypothetical protein